MTFSFPYGFDKASLYTEDWNVQDMLLFKLPFFPTAKA